MLSKTLADTFPDIKKVCNIISNIKWLYLIKECSNLVIDLSHELKDKLGDHSNVIAKGIQKNFSHQHSKVRKITVEVSIFR